jgi:ABC-2 type transport system permease protein
LHKKLQQHIMSKILIILKREYLTRVRNKTFLISTILSPLLIVGIIGVTAYFSSNTAEGIKFLVIDQTKQIAKDLQSDPKGVQFVTDSTAAADTSLQSLVTAGYDGKLEITKDALGKIAVGIKSKKNVGLMNEVFIQKEINRVLQRQALVSNNVDPKLLDSITKQRVSLNIQKFDKKNKLENSDSALASGIGYGSGFLMYILVLIFGSQVMRGVSEEKTNRIAEVMVSSVKPFELMMGKILGIGLVGLTGFVIWITISLLMQMLLPLFLSSTAVDSAQSMNVTNKLGTMFSAVNWPTILGCFAFYFFGGYLFYASMFAAIGSAVGEDAAEAQQISFPVTLPIIAGIVILMNALATPNSALATWASIIPFTSSIVMMGRIPYGVPSTVPYWQLGLSMVVLIASIIFMTWIAGRIYRTGILMYGKKASWKEIFKWLIKG